MKLLLVHNNVSPNAPPDEADVLVQAEAIGSSLESLGHQVTQFSCGMNLEELETALTALRPDAVINLVESLGGQGRLIPLVPATLEARGMPFTGCPADAVYLTSHKTLAKTLLHQAGLPTAPWVTGGPWEGLSSHTGPWIIKSVWEDASLGLDDDAIVESTPAALLPLLDARQGSAGAPWFAEAYIAGREFNIALLDGPQGPEVLPHAEMLFKDFPESKPHIVGYAAKWHEDSFEYTNTVRTFDFPNQDSALLQEMSRLALACWNLFHLRGWARVDFRVDETGQPWILEANVNPCLAPDAGFAAALAQAGIGFTQAIGRILATAG